MMKFFLLLYFIQFGDSKIQCNTKFMSSYGYQGYIYPQKKRTLFCKNVTQKCCSLLDELKFMKFWRTHYQEKLQKTFDLFELKFVDLSKTMQKLHLIDFKDLKKFIDDDKQEQGLELQNQIRKFDTETFKKISSELQSVKDYEDQQKKQFICYICDLNTHINISNIDQKLYMEQKFCESFITNYQSFLKAKIIQLDAILTKIFQLIDIINIKIENFKLTELELKELVGVTEQSLRCLNSGYSIDNCRSLCARYSIANLSPTVFANLPLQNMLEKSLTIMINYIEQSKKAEFEKLEKEKKKLKDIVCKPDDAECEQKKKEAEQKLQKKEEVVEEKKEPQRKLKLQLKSGRVLQSHRRKLKNQKDQFFLNEYHKHKKRYLKYRKRRLQRYIQQRRKMQQQQQWSYIPVPIPQTQNFQPQQNDYEEKEYLRERIRRIKRKLEKAEKEKAAETKKKEEAEKQKQEEKFDMKNFEELQKKQKELLKEEFRKKLFNEQKISVYKKYYEGLQKGDSKEFENLYTLTNHFFDGDFLDNYLLGFAFTGGVTSQQELTKEFIASEEKLFDTVVQTWSENQPPFQFVSSKKCTFDVVDFLNQYVETDVIEFNINIKMIFGSIKKGDPINYDDVKKDLMEKMIPRIEEYDKEVKKQLEKIKNKSKPKGDGKKDGKGDKKEGEQPPADAEKPAEDKPAEQAQEERRLLKTKIKNLKRQLKEIKNYFNDNQIVFKNFLYINTFSLSTLSLDVQSTNLLISFSSDFKHKIKYFNATIILSISLFYILLKISNNVLNSFIIFIFFFYFLQYLKNNSSINATAFNQNISSILFFIS